MYLFANEIIIPERLKVGVRISHVYKQVKFVALITKTKKSYGSAAKYPHQTVVRVIAKSSSVCPLHFLVYLIT